MPAVRAGQGRVEIELFVHLGRLIPVVTTESSLMADYLTIGKVARATGINIETIRYYEREGLLPAPRRSAGGHRLYAPDRVQRLNFIRRSRELGFSMAEIRELLGIVDGDQVSCEHVKQIADRHAEAVRLKIADLRRIEQTLRELSARCSGDDVPDCPIVDALSAR